MNIPEVPILEHELSDGLEPIRGAFLAHALFTAMHLRLFDVITSSPGISIPDLSQACDLEPRRVQGLVTFLVNEKYLAIQDEDRLFIQDAASRVMKLWPWYYLLIGGYGQTLLELPQALKAGANYATRNGAMVAIGSCGISQHDALPMSVQMLRPIADEFDVIVDLGCGDGSYLMDLCQVLGSIDGMGFDPTIDSVRIANEAVAHRGLSGSVSFHVGSMQDCDPSLVGDRTPCFLTAFVLQEVIEQSGRDVLIKLLREIFAKHPSAYLAVIEVDHEPLGKRVSTPLGLAYYNPYYLLHTLTEQRLESVSYWHTLFEEAGLERVSEARPAPEYDSLALKVGFLLRKKRLSQSLPA